MQLISPDREIQTTPKIGCIFDVARIDKEGRLDAPIRQVDNFAN